MAGQPLKNPEICLELSDSSEKGFRAAAFFACGARDAESQAARLGEQFVRQNRAIFSAMDVVAACHYDGVRATLHLSSGVAVGAVPLASPTSARPDFGLVVQPRFPWKGIGLMLGEMGWRVVPSPLKLPLMRRSERRVPAWVLSAMVLARLESLLRGLDQRFELARSVRSAPRGAILWSEYATRHLTRGRAVDVPCAYPELSADRTLMSSIRFALEKQLRALQGQAAMGAAVAGLIGRCSMLLRLVQDVAPIRPAPLAFRAWLRRPMRAAEFIEGIEAIQWTTEDRGLAGLSDLEGLPWRMDMSAFFEAYVEAVAARIARRLGGALRVGRLRQTLHSIEWDGPRAGSQASLVPDIWLEWPDVTLIIDAKYKRHWEELHRLGWQSLMSEERDRHRADILQVLAYANLPRTQRVIACLVYPCQAEAWASRRSPAQLVQRASVGGGRREVELWLAAAPMDLPIAAAAEPLEEALRRALRG